VKQLEIKINNTAEAIAARTIALVQPNAYKETIFVQTNGTWTTLRNGSSVTDVSAITGTTSVGYWQTGSSSNLSITNTGTAAFRYYRFLVFAYHLLFLVVLNNGTAI